MNTEAIKQKAKELVAQMTLEEKAGLCSGLDCWHTKPVERLGLESVMVSDGPHGLRKQITLNDNMGIGKSVPAVCFPTASALACSFDRDLVYSVGQAMGDACVEEGVSAILGPGANQKRSPLCGRNFEYYSEDPVLSGELAASLIQGVQSTGTGTSLKHFAVNNQEKRRTTVSAVVDERTLRETYLKAFEIAVKKGKPATVMCAYNKVNGTYCSENETLLTNILRDEWGFDGVVVSDWGAVHDRALGVKAGLDLEMPGSRGINDAKIVAAVKAGTLSDGALDTAACRVVEFALKGIENKREGFTYDKQAQHALAVKAAQQSAVLLKNDVNLLPGHAGQKAAVIGAFAKDPRYQGAGSSKINPIQIDTPWEALQKLGLNAVYAQGYSLKGSTKDSDKLISEACEAAKGKDIVYIFAGLSEGYESEGFDRENLSLPQAHNELISAVSRCNPNVAVILMGGAPMTLPWINDVKAVLAAYLGGEGVGTAVANLLLGAESPSGKLAETWPLSADDIPCRRYMPGGRHTVEYRESIYVGYRYYEKANKDVLFPFGQGLSYARFAYSDLQLDRSACEFGEQINVSFNITNTGSIAAKETALIFVSHPSDMVFMPEKQLKDFVKVSLQPGETKSVSVALNTADFGYYNTQIHDWYAESGTYRILIGSSSRDIRLETDAVLKSPDKPQPDLRNVAPSYFDLPQDEWIIPDDEFETLYGSALPLHDGKIQKPYTLDHTLEDTKHTLMGKVMLMYAKMTVKKLEKAEPGQAGMMLAMMQEMPFYAMITSGEISEKMMSALVDMMNGRYFKGLRRLLSR